MKKRIMSLGAARKKSIMSLGAARNFKSCKLKLSRGLAKVILSYTVK